MAMSGFVPWFPDWPTTTIFPSACFSIERGLSAWVVKVMIGWGRRGAGRPLAGTCASPKADAPLVML